MSPEQERELGLPREFGWKGRALGILMFAAGAISYLADVVPYELKTNAAERRAVLLNEINQLRADVEDRADRIAARSDYQDRLLDELLRNQMRIMERLQMTPSYATQPRESGRR